MNSSVTDKHRKLVWMASYPKSGNTWFRAFLSALFGDGHLNINNLKLDCIFSSRSFFYKNTDIDSTYLYDEEAKIVLPDIFRQVAKNSSDLLYIKVHDAFEHNNDGKTIIPEDVTRCAVYFIRNPLDIVGSLTSHNQTSLDYEANFINDKLACFAAQHNNFNRSSQVRQHLSDWSNHVLSWTTRPSFPVLTIRYEDMVLSPFNTFKQIIKHIGLEKFNDIDILNAIEACDFKNLQAQELEKGFFEKSNEKTPAFFRKGGINNWKDELNESQINTIVTRHKETMILYNYI